MSFARKRGNGSAGYRTGYLHSTAWFARRDRWFTDEHHTLGAIRCQLCGAEGDSRTLELHHLSYDGVTRQPGGTWSAREAHEELIPLHPTHHEWVHRLLDRDRALARMGSRRVATSIAIRRLRAALQPGTEEP